MLKELFESSFYKTYPPKEDTLVNINERTHSGLFSLYDPLACHSCVICLMSPTSKENIKRPTHTRHNENNEPIGSSTFRI